MTGFFKKNDDNVHSSTLRSFLKKRLHSQMRPILKKNDYKFIVYTYPMKAWHVQTGCL